MQHHNRFCFASNPTMPSAFQRSQSPSKESDSGPHGRAGTQAEGGFPSLDTRRHFLACLRLHYGALRLWGAIPTNYKTDATPASQHTKHHKTACYMGPAIPNELIFPRLRSKRRPAPGFRDLKTRSKQSQMNDSEQLTPQTGPDVCSLPQMFVALLLCMEMP